MYGSDSKNAMRARIKEEGDIDRLSRIPRKSAIEQIERMAVGNLAYIPKAMLALANQERSATQTKRTGLIGLCHSAMRHIWEVMLDSAKTFPDAADITKQLNSILDTFMYANCVRSKSEKFSFSVWQQDIYRILPPKGSHISLTAKDENARAEFEKVCARAVKAELFTPSQLKGLFVLSAEGRTPPENAKNADKPVVSSP